MTAKQKSTLWTIVLIVVAIVAFIWLWPKILTAIRSAQSGSSSGASGGMSASSPFSSLWPFGNPNQNPYQANGSNPLGGLANSLFGGNNASGSGLSAALSGWINGVQQQGWANAATLPVDDSGDVGYGDMSIPYESFNWDGYSPNDFLVTQDVPGDSGDSGDTSSEDQYASDLDQMQVLDSGAGDYISDDSGGSGSLGQFYGY